MKAPESFKYSPNGFTVVEVVKDEPMCEAATQAAIDLKVVTKTALAKANKAEREQADQESATKSTGPDANKATGPDSNKAG